MTTPLYSIVAGRTAWWPVPFTVPAQDDPGHVVAQTIQVQFAFWGEDALASLEAKTTEIVARTGDAEPKPGEVSAELYMTIVKDWRGVGDGDGKPLAFTLTNFAAFLNALPGFERRALLPAYQACLAGEGEIRAGN